MPVQTPVGPVLERPQGPSQTVCSVLCKHNSSSSARSSWAAEPADMLDLLTSCFFTEYFVCSPPALVETWSPNHVVSREHNQSFKCPEAEGPGGVRPWFGELPHCQHQSLNWMKQQQGGGVSGEEEWCGRTSSHLIYTSFNLFLYTSFWTLCLLRTSSSPPVLLLSISSMFSSRHPLHLLSTSSTRQPQLLTAAGPHCLTFSSCWSVKLSLLLIALNAEFRSLLSFWRSWCSACSKHACLFGLQYCYPPSVKWIGWTAVEIIEGQTVRDSLCL